MLARWRLGVPVGAVAIAVGRFLPHGARWPFRALRLGDGRLPVGVLVVGAIRQQRNAEGLRRGSCVDLNPSPVNWLTALAILLSIVAIALAATAFWRRGRVVRARHR